MPIFSAASSCRATARVVPKCFAISVERWRPPVRYEVIVDEDAKVIGVGAHFLFWQPVAGVGLVEHRSPNGQGRRGFIQLNHDGAVVLTNKPKSDLRFAFVSREASFDQLTQVRFISTDVNCSTGPSRLPIQRNIARHFIAIQ